jgi:hypothetical protein
MPVVSRATLSLSMPPIVPSRIDRRSTIVGVSAPPAFAWDAWYDAVGGRSIRLDAVDEYLRLIREEQQPRLTGEVAPRRHGFETPVAASAHLKEKARLFGADIAGICEIEPSDVYHAVAVGQRMRWREFQVVPSRESAIECLRVYFTLGETVIQLAAYIRSLATMHRRASNRRQRPAAHPDRSEGRVR